MQITKSNVEGAFKRLHKAMEWPDMPPWQHMPPWKPGSDSLKANVGAVYLAEGYRCWTIEIITTETGGTLCPFVSWQSKRQAWDTMVAMARAVEDYKTAHEAAKAA